MFPGSDMLCLGRRYLRFVVRFTKMLNFSGFRPRFRVIVLRSTIESHQFGEYFWHQIPDL